MLCRRGLHYFYQYTRTVYEYIVSQYYLLLGGIRAKIEILSYETTPTFYGWNRQCYDI